MNKKNYSLTKYTCYFTYLSMSSVFALPPILFVTFREVYGVSYTLLGTLVLVNFCTQLAVDLLFTFFSKYFNIKLTVRIMPLLTTIGLVIYALFPLAFPDHAYAGLIIGTVVFSAAAGLSEVLLSPIVAALPSDDPERDMSLLHSLYAWGVLMVVLVSTAFLNIFGAENRTLLILLWAALPLISFVLYCIAPIPDIGQSSGEDKNASDVKYSSKRKLAGLALFVVCIFLGSASENAMTNWISTYTKNALHISETLADVLGFALFAALLGLTRMLYARFGKNIYKMLLISMSGAAVCYIVVGFSPFIPLSMVACVLTGIFTSMLWPGSLIMMEETYPKIGVAAYALMAAGGDFGGSTAPQFLGAIVDTVSASGFAQDLAVSLSMTPEEIGMKVGMIAASLFPIAGVVVLLVIRSRILKPKQNKT